MRGDAGSAPGALTGIAAAPPLLAKRHRAFLGRGSSWQLASRLTRQYWAVATVVLVVLLGYGRFISAGLVSTDFWPHIASNQLRSLEDLVRLFREPLGVIDAPYVEVIGRHYRPLSAASYALDYALWGLDRPEGWQITNLAIHLGVCLALYAFVRELGLNRVAAVIAVVVFTSHPAIVATEPAIARRHDTLSALFLLVGLTVLLRGWLVPATVLFTCSLLAKEISLAALPLVPVVLLVARRPVRWSLVVVPAVLVAVGARVLALGDLGGYGTASLASMSNAGAEAYVEKLVRFFQDMLAPAFLPIQNQLVLAAVASIVVVGAVWLAFRCPPRERVLALLGLAWALAFAFMYTVLRVYAGAWYLYQPLLGIGLYAGAVCMGLRSVGFAAQPRALAAAGLSGLIWLHASPLFTPYPEWQDMGQAVSKYLALVDVCAEHLNRPFRPLRRGPYAEFVDANGLLDYSVRSYIQLRFQSSRRPCQR